MSMLDMVSNQNKYGWDYLFQAPEQKQTRQKRAKSTRSYKNGKGGCWKKKKPPNSTCNPRKHRCSKSWRWKRDGNVWYCCWCVILFLHFSSYVLLDPFLLRLCLRMVVCLQEVGLMHCVIKVGAVFILCNGYHFLLVTYNFQRDITKRQIVDFREK